MSEEEEGMRVGVLTVSDSCSRGEAQDKSGRATHQRSLLNADKPAFRLRHNLDPDPTLILPN